ETKPPGVQALAQQRLQARLVERQPPGFQRADPRRVDIHAEDAEPERGEAGGGRGAQVPGAEHGDPPGPGHGAGLLCWAGPGSAAGGSAAAGSAAASSAAASSAAASSVAASSAAASSAAASSAAASSAVRGAGGCACGPAPGQHSRSAMTSR